MFKMTMMIVANAALTLFLLPYYLVMYLIGKPAKMVSVGNVNAKMYGEGYKEVIDGRREAIKDMLNKSLKRKKK